MKRITLAVAFILAWAATAAVAQSPSMGGKWTLTSGSRLALGGPEFTALHDARTLTVVTTQGPSKFVYNLDGSESTNTIRIGGLDIPQRCNLKQSGGKLILTAAYRAQGLDIVWTETWTVESSGDLTVEVDYLQGERRTLQKATYKKG